MSNHVPENPEQTESECPEYPECPVCYNSLTPETETYACTGCLTEICTTCMMDIQQSRHVRTACPFCRKKWRSLHPTPLHTWQRRVRRTRQVVDFLRGEVVDNVQPYQAVAIAQMILMGTWLFANM